eukprot:gene5607-4009_t
MHENGMEIQMASSCERKHEFIDLDASFLQQRMLAYSADTGDYLNSLAYSNVKYLLTLLQGRDVEDTALEARSSRSRFAHQIVTCGPSQAAARSKMHSVVAFFESIDSNPDKSPSLAGFSVATIRSFIDGGKYESMSSFAHDVCNQLSSCNSSSLSFGKRLYLRDLEFRLRAYLIANHYVPLTAMHEVDEESQERLRTLDRISTHIYALHAIDVLGLLRNAELFAVSTSGDSDSDSSAGSTFAAEEPLSLTELQNRAASGAYDRLEEFRRDVEWMFLRSRQQFGMRSMAAWYMTSLQLQYESTAIGDDTTYADLDSQFRKLVGASGTVPSDGLETIAAFDILGVMPSLQVAVYESNPHSWRAALLLGWTDCVKLSASRCSATLPQAAPPPEQILDNLLSPQAAPQPEHERDTLHSLLRVCVDYFGAQAAVCRYLFRVAQAYAARRHLQPIEYPIDLWCEELTANQQRDLHCAEDAWFTMAVTAQRMKLSPPITQQLVALLIALRAASPVDIEPWVASLEAASMAIGRYRTGQLYLLLATYRTLDRIGNESDVLRWIRHRWTLLSASWAPLSCQCALELLNSPRDGAGPPVAQDPSAHDDVTSDEAADSDEAVPAASSACASGGHMDSDDIDTVCETSFFEATRPEGSDDDASTADQSLNVHDDGHSAAATEEVTTTVIVEYIATAGEDAVATVTTRGTATSSLPLAASTGGDGVEVVLTDAYYEHGSNGELLYLTVQLPEARKRSSQELQSASGDDEHEATTKKPRNGPPLRDAGDVSVSPLSSSLPSAVSSRSSFDATDAIAAAEAVAGDGARTRSSVTPVPTETTAHRPSATVAFLLPPKDDDEDDEYQGDGAHGHPRSGVHSASSASSSNRQSPYGASASWPHSPITSFIIAQSYQMDDEDDELEDAGRAEMSYSHGPHGYPAHSEMDYQAAHHPHHFSATDDVPIASLSTAQWTGTLPPSSPSYAIPSSAIPLPSAPLPLSSSSPLLPPLSGTASVVVPSASSSTASSVSETETLAANSVTHVHVMASDAASCAHHRTDGRALVRF